MNALLQTMNRADWAAVILVLIGIIQGFRHGLSGEFAGLCAVILGIACGCLLYAPLVHLVTPAGQETAAMIRYLMLAAAAIIAVLVMLALRHLFTLLIQLSFRTFIDRLAGVGAGIVQSSALVLILFVALTTVPHPRLQRVFGKESVIGRFIVGREQAILETLSGDIDKGRAGLRDERDRRTEERTPGR
jgi:uncharacterized membrane protein required for colicin V production